LASNMINIPTCMLVYYANESRGSG
jgi:hypothetical protein